MFKLDDNLLIELGLGALPPDEKNRMLGHIYETLEMRVGMKLAQRMSNDQLNEFEAFINRNDEAGALRWLETNFPNYKQVVADELENLKQEIKQTAPQIVAASQQAAVTAAAQPQAVQAVPPAPVPQAAPPQPQVQAYPQYPTAPSAATPAPAPLPNSFVNNNNTPPPQPTYQQPPAPLTPQPQAVTPGLDTAASQQAPVASPAPVTYPVAPVSYPSVVSPTMPQATNTPQPQPGMGVPVTNQPTAAIDGISPVAAPAAPQATASPLYPNPGQSQVTDPYGTSAQ